MSVSTDIGIFSFDASSNFAKSVQDTEYSESFYYLEKIQLPTAMIKPGLATMFLTKDGSAAYNA